MFPAIPNPMEPGKYGTRSVSIEALEKAVKGRPLAGSCLEGEYDAFELERRCEFDGQSGSSLLYDLTFHSKK